MKFSIWKYIKGIKFKHTKTLIWAREEIAIKNILVTEDDITIGNMVEQILSKLNELQVGRLFDRFYTVESMEKSVGLGLSIAKVLTEQMNGSILAEYINGSLSIQINFPNDKVN